MLGQPKVYVAGHQGMVGSAIVRALQSSKNAVIPDPGSSPGQALTRDPWIADQVRNDKEKATIITRTHAELDLCDQAAVRTFFEAERPDQVYLPAVKPDGTPRKLMDSSHLNAMGWHAHVDLEQGLTLAYRDFLKNL